MSSLLSKRGLSHDNKVSLKTFQGSIKKMMPHFPYEQLKILKQLSQGEREYSLKKEGIYYLEKSKFINRMYEVTFDSFIFQINPLVKSVLSDYLISIRTESLKSFVENITEVEKRFLSVFFEDIIHEGTCESGKMMRPDVFSSSSSMVSKDFLEHFSRGSKTSSKEGFRLYPETEKILEKVVFGKSCVRKEVCLDTRFILAGASGSGSIGHTKGKGIGLF